MKSDSTPQSDTDTLLRTSELTKKFGGLTAIDRIDFSVKQGEIHGIIGPNGAGKSTLLNLVTGQLTPDSGKIKYAGTDITRQDPYKRIRQGIGIKPQVPGVYEDLTVADNLRLSLQRGTSWSTIEENTEIILKDFNLEKSAGIQAKNLSHGQQQWLDLAMVTALDPKLLLLDEPTAGMTRDETEQTANIVKNLNRTREMTTVAIEHDIDFVEEIATKVSVLHQGKILKEGKMSAITNDQRVRDVYLGTSQ